MPKDSLRIHLGIALVMAMVLAVGCSPAAEGPSRESRQAAAEPKRGGILMIALGAASDLPSFDLHQEVTSATSSSAGPLHDNLIKLDPLKPAEIVPDLAEKWEMSPDGKSYTFTLHKGVKFHNGNPFTSADVKFSLERIKDPPKGVKSPRQTTLEAISSIETPNDYTVKLNLRRPSPSLLLNLAIGWMAMYDREWVTEKDQHRPEKELNGTGPYKLKEYIRGTSVEVERNPGYWVEGRPYLDGVKLFLVPDAGSRLAALRAGQLMMLDVSASELKSLEGEMSDKLTFQRGVGLGNQNMTMNVNRRPFDDPRVREAVNLVIDRHAAVQVLAEGEGEVGGYMTPGGAWSLPQEEILKLPGYGKDKTKDIERAKQLLAEAGYPNGFDTRIQARNLQGYIDFSIFFIDQLKKIGVNAELKLYETAQSYDQGVKGDFDLFPGSNAPSMDDPDAVYGVYYTCSAARNYGRLCSEEIDSLYEKQSQEVDPAKRKALVLEMERKAVPTASRVVTHYGKFRNASWKFVKNWVRHQQTDNNYRYRDIWLDK